MEARQGGRFAPLPLVNYAAGYKQSTVNHQQYCVDLATGAHTQVFGR